MDDMETCWVAYTTVNAREKAQALARQLVSGKHVACVSILGPVESVYEWQGQLEQTMEWMLMMKCSGRQRMGLKSAVLAWHDYAVPELVMWPIQDGHEAYLKWIEASAGGAA